MSPSEIPPEAAYEAARDRALRTTDALILAEGQVRYLSAQLDRVSAERDRYATEAGKARQAQARRRVRDRQRRARRRAEEEVEEDAAEDADPVGYAYAVGQAD